MPERLSHANRLDVRKCRTGNELVFRWPAFADCRSRVFFLWHKSFTHRQPVSS